MKLVVPWEWYAKGDAIKDSEIDRTVLQFKNATEVVLIKCKKLRHVVWKRSFVF